MFFLLPAAIAADLSFADVLSRVPETPAFAAVKAEETAETEAARARGAWQGNPELSGDWRPDEAGLTVSVPVDLSAPARHQAAGTVTAAVRSRAEIGRATVVIAGASLWLDARRSQDQAGLWQNLVPQASSLSEIAKKRADAGEWSAADLALMEADAANILERSLRAEQDARGSLRTLCAFLGLPSDPLPTLADWPRLMVPATPDLATLPTLVTADLEARAALARAQAARAAQLPQMALAGGYVAQVGPTAGFSLELPLFAPRVAEWRAALADADRSQALQRQAQQEAAALLRSAQEELAVSQRVAEAWSRVDLQPARDRAEAQLATGEIDLPTYLTLRDRMIQQASEAIDARWRLARATLALWELTGQTPQEKKP